MVLTLSTPLSLYSIPIVYFVGFYPHTLKAILVQNTVGFNNVAPRGSVTRLSDKKADPQIIAKAARMEAAHTNGNETFPLWAAAVVVGNLVGLDHKVLNAAALTYIGLRIAFNQVYINQKTQAQGHTRSLLFTSALCIPIYILISAANLARSR